MTETTVTEAVLQQIAQDIHATARDKGFWVDPAPFFGLINSKLLLVVSEVAEAMEVLRKSYSDGLPNPGYHMTEMQGEDFIEEVADIIIRAFDLAVYVKAHGNIAEVVLAKMQHNARRPHMHGKRF